jgi:hypothetical protein
LEECPISGVVAFGFVEISIFFQQILGVSLVKEVFPSVITVIVIVVVVNVVATTLSTKIKAQQSISN